MSDSPLRLTTAELRSTAPSLRAGDSVLLSGTVYTARDAAHKRFFELLKQGQPLPIPVRDAVIYFAGPTPARPGHVVGSCGPTTSGRMDPYTPTMLRLGVEAVIGKGIVSAEVREALRETGSLYFAAIGGAGAVAARSITSLEVAAFDDLGCESVKRLTFKDFPLIVAADSFGGCVYDMPSPSGAETLDK